MKVAAYIRVSTDREEQKDSLVNQKEQIYQYIKERGYELHDFYVDVESGTTDKRAGLKKLIEDTNHGMFDVIVCKELSRLARNGELSYKLKRITESNNVHIITMDGAIDTTDPTKQNMFGLYAWIYEEESQRISDRIKAVFRTKTKNGEYLGSIAPYGYRIENKKLISRDDDTVETVRFIYSMYLNGWGVDRIANHLTKTGIPTSAQVAGKKNAGWIWHGSTVSKILRNQAYIGDLVHNKETTTSVTNKKRKKVDKDEQVVFPNAHTPLIERETWENVQLLIEKKKGNKSIGKGEKHLFTGFLKCPDCGRGFHFRQDRKGYICGGYGKHRKIVCSSHMVKEKLLIDIILSDIQSFCSNLEKEDILSRVQKKTESSGKRTQSKITRISNQIEKLKKRKGNFINLLADGDISKYEYNEQLTETKSEINSLEKEKASLEDSLNNSSDIDKLTFLKTELENFLKFDTLTKEMLNLLVDKIEVNKDGVPVIYYRFAPVFESVI